MILIRTIFILISIGSSCLFGFFYYSQYFIWRDCFNELGRCYDPESGVVYLEQAGGIWLSLALLALGIALLLIWRRRRKRR